MIDFQFAGIIDDCDKSCLDDFPVRVEPIVEGIDKAVRDRYDVFTFKLRELQPGWTMRRFAYLLDLRVGRGRLMVSGFNLTGVERGVPEACAMFESLVECVVSPSWKPSARIKERMMTQFWQFDNAPLETDQYWREAEEWIRSG